MLQIQRLIRVVLEMRMLWTLPPIVTHMKAFCTPSYAVTGRHSLQFPLGGSRRGVARCPGLGRGRAIFLKKRGIAAIINLRGRNDDLSWWRNETAGGERAPAAQHFDAMLDSRKLPTRPMLAA